jgi:hypothetical protein|tara:strand:- start:326 stop:535 length:210 start_codon:yes stop_codon:yes gene_type:complete
VLKFFLVGWVCVGLNPDQVCVRAASEVIFDNYEDCNQYYELIRDDLQNLNQTIKMKYTCVQTGLLEDLL